MADRRMLWKSVSQSKKVNSLSLPAALLWTWCIPWFDRDGCMEAEADFLKFNVAPRRRELDESSISDLVEEIINSGLWILFRDPEGRKVVKDPKFKEKQKFEYKKEVESRWASSKWEGKELEFVSTRRVVAECSASPRAEGKVREGKVREGKEREYEGKPEDPVDNPKPLKEPFKRNCTEEQRHKIEELTMKLTPYWRTCQKWIKDNILTAHPEAIIQTLDRIDQYRPANPYEYANKIISVEHGNFNERDFSLKAEEGKADFKAILDDLKRRQKELNRGP